MLNTQIKILKVYFKIKSKSGIHLEYVGHFD